MIKTRPKKDETSKQLEAIKKKHQTEVSNCLLNSNSIFTVTGVGIGLFVGIQRKSLLPLALFSAIGTAGDMIYGYFYNCKDFIADLNKAGAALRQYENEQMKKK
jgi:hypothetical protein